MVWTKSMRLWSVYWPFPLRSSGESAVPNSYILICQRENEHCISTLGSIILFIILPLETKYKIVDLQWSTREKCRSAQKLRYHIKWVDQCIHIFMKFSTSYQAKSPQLHKNAVLQCLAHWTKWYHCKDSSNYQIS